MKNSIFPLARACIELTIFFIGAPDLFWYFYAFFEISYQTIKYYNPKSFYSHKGNYMEADFIIGMKALKKEVRISESTIRRYMELGLFPRSIFKNDSDIRAWKRIDIQEWKEKMGPKVYAEIKKNNHFGNGNRKWTNKYKFNPPNKDSKALESLPGPFDELEDVFAQMHSGLQHPLL